MLVFRAGSPKIPIFYDSLLTPLSETGGEGSIIMICQTQYTWYRGWGVDSACVCGGGGGGGVCMCTYACTFVCVCVCVRARVRACVRIFVHNSVMKNK